MYKVAAKEKKFLNRYEHFTRNKYTSVTALHDDKLTVVTGLILKALVWAKKHFINTSK